MRGLTLLIVLSTLPRPAMAQSEAAATFAKGLELFKKLDYLGALERFEKAYLLKPHYAPLCNIGRCHERLGNMVKAKTFFERCLKEGANKAAVKGQMETALRRVSARITWVEVRSPGEGGDLYLDGARVGRAPGRIAVSPGTRTIEVRRTGFKPAMTKITTRGGEERVVELVPTEQPQTILPPPPPPAAPSLRTLPSYWFWTGAAATAALTAVSIVFGLKSLADRDDFEKKPTYEAYDKAKESRLTANILIGATLAVAGATTTLFFFTDFSGKRSSQEQALFGIGVRGVF